MAPVVARQTVPYTLYSLNTPDRARRSGTAAAREPIILLRAERRPMANWGPRKSSGLKFARSNWEGPAKAGRDLVSCNDTPCHIATMLAARFRSLPASCRKLMSTESLPAWQPAVPLQHKCTVGAKKALESTHMYNTLLTIHVIVPI
jgi:hypothetical protein